MSKYYHGSEKKITKFVDDFVGGKEAVDQSGPGIYFTKSYEQARAYGPHIHIVDLIARKIISNEEGTSVDRDELLQLIKGAPEWEDTAYNFSENPEEGAYKAVEMILKYDDNQLDQFSQVWADWYRYSPVEYVRNLFNLGYDMADVNFKSGDGSIIKNAIVYNPSIIKSVDYEYNKVDESIKIVKKIIKEEIENIMALPVVRRTLSDRYTEIQLVDSDELEKEDEEMIQEATGRFKIPSYNRNAGEIEIVFPNGSKSYKYGSVSPFLYDKIKLFIKKGNNRAVQNIISKFTKLH